MKNLLNQLLLIIFIVPSLAFANWNITPNIYSRGGITVKDDFSKKENKKNTNGDDNKARFNLGAWSEESNAISDPLTEVTMTFFNSKNVKYVYGVDVNNSNRQVDGTAVSLNERLNFITFIKENNSLWFGNRAYRGDGDYLSRSFPFDEHNMFGGGIRLEKKGPVNIEFAYGVKQNTDPHIINLFINKIEYPLANGKIKTNLEMHQVNSEVSNEKSKAYMAGIQFQRWGDKIGTGSLYNIFLINYSHGYMYGGGMQSAYNSSNKNTPASKWVVKWGGDFKAKKYGVFYTFKYQDHMGDAEKQRWAFVDLHIRPVYAFTENVTFGLDYQQRVITDGAVDIDWGETDNYKLGSSKRAALMVAYNMTNKPFDDPTISIFVGHIIKEIPTVFYSDEGACKSENFVRFNYEISI